MQSFKQQIPVGVQDYLTQECLHKRNLEESLRRQFVLCGYDEIETPTFEYYDVFADGVGFTRQEQMLKFFDEHGRILVLRPDITTPIARLVATKLKDEQPPFRFCYIGNAYGTAYVNGLQREFTQAGIELLGEKGPSADAEVIALSISALMEAGLENFQIDIGQVEFFKGLMEESGLAQEDVDKLRQYVEEKNMLAIDLFLEHTGVSDQVAEKIRALPSLFGGPEVFEKASRLTKMKRCQSAIANIRDVYAILTALGLEQYVSIDLGMVQSINYYSGIIFRGITNDLGFPILAGGRYDGLVKEFGRDLAATGFAVGVKRILIALERQGKLSQMMSVDTVVGFDNAMRKTAYTYMNDLRKKNVRVIPFWGTKDELKDYAKTRNIPNAVYIQKEGITKV